MEEDWLFFYPWACNTSKRVLISSDFRWLCLSFVEDVLSGYKWFNMYIFSKQSCYIVLCLTNCFLCASGYAPYLSIVIGNIICINSLLYLECCRLVCYLLNLRWIYLVLIFCRLLSSLQGRWDWTEYYCGYHVSNWAKACKLPFLLC